MGRLVCPFLSVIVILFVFSVDLAFGVSSDPSAHLSGSETLTYTLALKCHLTKSAQKEQEVTLVPYNSTSGILGFLAPRASLAMSGTWDRQASPLGVGGFVSCVPQDHTRGLGSSFQF